MKTAFFNYVGLLLVLLLASCNGDDVRPTANIRIVNETGYNGDLHVSAVVSMKTQLNYTFENKNFGAREEVMLEVPVPDEHPYNIIFNYYGYDSQLDGNILIGEEKHVYVSAGTTQTIILSHN